MCGDTLYLNLILEDSLNFNPERKLEMNTNHRKYNYIYNTITAQCFTIILQQTFPNFPQNLKKRHKRFI